MQLELAAYGWQGPEWAALYPEDLPSEWRLDYYSNEFSSIVVPAANWRTSTIDEGSTWVKETPGHLRFYWEIDDADGASRLLELLAQDTVRGKIVGWLFHPGLSLEHSLIEALTEVLPGAAYGESPVPTLQAEQMAAAGITLCWQDGEMLNCRGRGLRVLQIEHLPELRVLRQIIEEQSAAGVVRLLLLLKPGAVSPSQLRELDTFISLFSG